MSVPSLTRTSLALALISIPLLQACGHAPTEKSPLAVVVGVHRNGPAPVVPPLVDPEFTAALTSNSPVTVLAVDGDPQVVPVEVGTVDHTAVEIRKRTLKKAKIRLVQGVTGAKADSDHANLLDAIGLAVGGFPKGAERGTIVVIDNGLSDKGALAPTQPGMLGPSVDPADVAKHVKATTAIDLSGVHVRMIGLGTAAGEQNELSATEKQRLEKLWATVLAALGAEVEIDSTPLGSSQEPETEFVTDTALVSGEVSYAPPARCATSTAVFDESKIAFRDDSNELRTPAEARKAIAGVVGWLRGNSGRSVDLIGTTSSAGDTGGRAERSLGRARTVERLLIKAGVAKGQIGKVSGLGMDFEGYVPDRTSDGGLDPINAAANRTTRIVMHAEC